MKKIILSLVVLLGIFSIASCNGASVSVTELEVSGQKTEFIVGEAFETGELKVVAKLSDGTTPDVSKEVKVSGPESIDAVGTYAVVVSYAGQSEVYYINVAPVPAEAELVLNLGKAKLSYVVGESLNVEGVVAYEVKGNALEVVELNACEVKVLDAEGNAVEGAFKVAGEYVVEVAYNGNKASYQVSVSINSYENIADAIAAATASAGNVQSGAALIGSYGSETIYIYEFGQDYLEVLVANNYYSEELHYELQKDGSVFGIKVSEEGNLSQIVDPSEAAINGVRFDSIINYAKEIYGVEALIEYLYAHSEEVVVDYYYDFISVCPSCDGHYEYSFEYGVVEGSQYKTYSVSFTLSPSESIIEAEVNIDVYYSDESLEKDEEGNVIGLVEGSVEPDYSHNVVVYQHDGERTLEHEYSASEYLYESFEVVDAEGNNVEGEKVEMNAGESLSLNIAAALPETASSSVDSIKVDITDESGNMTWSIYGSFYDGVITISAYALGTYNVVVSSTKVSVSFVLVVNEPALSEFNAGVYSYGSVVAQSSASVYVGVGLELGVAVNSYADDSHEAKIVSGDASATLVVDEYSGHYVFTASVVGKYEVLFTSKVDEKFTSSITIEVLEAPSFASVLTGKWQYDDYMAVYTYEFQPESEGATKGICVITIDDPWSGTSVHKIAYEVVNNQVVCTNTDGSEFADPYNEFAFTVDSNFNVIATYADGYEIGVMTRVPEASEDSIAGEYVYVLVAKVEVYHYLTLNEDGTGSYVLYDESGFALSGTFSWELVEGVINFSDVVATDDTDAVELSATYAEGVITLTYGSLTNEFVKSN